MNTLELALVRYRNTKGFTAGRIFADGEHLIYTLEDEEREIEGAPVGEWKKPKITAIPRGRYEITLRYSPKFRRYLPWLHDVPGYKWILIHSGNLVEHTDGCILTGMNDGNDRDAWSGRSRVAERLILSTIREALSSNKRVFITVV